MRTKYPFLTATLDDLISCSCCSTGLFEIKCPSTVAVGMLSHLILKMQVSVCIPNKRAQKYWILAMINYYQAQGKMAIWKKDYCNFVYWTNEGHVVKKLLSNVSIFNTYILPELMTRKLQCPEDIADNELSRLMTYSTYILTQDNCQDCFTSSREGCSFTFCKGWDLKLSSSYCNVIMYIQS